MKQLILTLIILISINYSFGQTDSLKDAILKYEDTTAITITKGRKLLLEHFLKNDKEKVQQLLTYLTTKVENDDYVALYPIEKGLINYWVGQYETFANDVPLYTEDYFKKSDRKLKPQKDLLFEKVKGYLQAHKEEQLHKIDSATSLANVDKSFLKINLIFFVSDYKRNMPMQDTLNTLTTDFLAKYPNSKYESFIKEQIRWSFKPTKLGYGLEFFTGYGVFTKTLSSQFRNNVPIGIGFEFSYKRVALYLRDYIGFSSTKEALPYPSATWAKDKQARVFLPELSVGYLCTTGDKVRVVPFAGISSTEITPTSKDQSDNPGYGHIGWKFTTTYTAGVNVDIRISKVFSLPYRATGIEKSYRILKLRYAYNAPQFQQKYAGLTGSMHYLTVGIGMLGKVYKRD